MRTKKYHHKELNETLIEKGIELINEIGYNDFTIRKLAVRCNVSHNAPYRHFKDKETLVQAIINRVVNSFEQAMGNSIEKNQGNPLEQIKQIGFCYIEFFVENPAYFSILFGSDIMGHVYIKNNSFSYEEAHLFGVLVQCFKEYWAINNQPFDQSVVLEYWSTVHGLTTLITSQKIIFKDSYMDYVSEIIERLAFRLK